MHLRVLSLFIFLLSPVLCFAEDAPRSWTEIFRGVSHTTIKQARPYPLMAQAIRVDSKRKAVRFLVTPANGEEKLETGARSTSEFLREFKCQVAINGGVFRPRVRAHLEPADVLGLAISNGERYSNPTKNHALLIDTKGRMRISKPPFPSKGISQALSGYRSILKDGKIIAGDGKKHPRSVVGLNGEELYLLVIDGRRPGISEGASLKFAAEIIKQLGARDALNLDGGGSSTLVVEEPVGSARILNTPSDGLERRVANHLCIFADRL